MTDATDAADAALLEQSAAAETPADRARVFGFDLAEITRASSRLRFASTAALVVGVMVVFFGSLGGTSPDLGPLVVGALLGFVAPVAMFVLAQILVRLFSKSGTDATVIATAPVTQVVASALMLGAYLLTPDSPSGFTGLLVGTLATMNITASGHVAMARSFDKHNPFLPQAARIWQAYPHWATIAYGQWVWVFLQSVLGGATAVISLLAYREGAPATLVVIVGLTLLSLVEGWALAKGRLALTIVLAVAELALVIVAWQLL